MLEALYDVIRQNNGTYNSKPLEMIFEALANDHLESYRVNFSLENGIVIPFESRAIHKQIVSPVLQLVGNPEWSNVETPYVKSILETTNGNYDDAITDVTTAVQEALRKVGCVGGDFSALMAPAKNSILKGYDQKLIDSFDKLIQWQSASRVNRGDGHKSVNPSKDEAWLTIHIGGALILYVSKI